MLYPSEDKIFDTMVDTNKIYVSMKTNFTLRKYPKSAVVYLTVVSGTERERINLDINIDPAEWNGVKKRLNPVNKEFADINLILDNYESKVTAIKTAYRLSERVLSPETLKKELFSDMPRVKFVPFFKNALEEEKINLSAGTYQRHLSVVKKIEAYQSEVKFIDLDYNWLNAYKKHLKSIGNQDTTIAANTASIKKFLSIAVKKGIKLRVNTDEITVGSTKGNRTSLNPNELKRCLGYFYSEFIPANHKLILGYFLFSCFTGLRISDVQNIKRELVDMEDDYISFVSKKTHKDQTIKLNQLVKKVIQAEPLLFVKKYPDQHINDELKKIMKQIGITKKVSFHVSRHTFATTYLRAGGNVQNLRLLLGHASINQTMIYVDILAAEANEDLSKLDDFLR
jgi:integrase/recombinase XerD